jgi:beta-glucanase (GH16 family)
METKLIDNRNTIQTRALRCAFVALAAVALSGAASADPTQVLPKAVAPVAPGALDPTSEILPDTVEVAPNNRTIKAPPGVPQTITSPLGYKRSLKFDDEFDAVTDVDGQPYIDRRKWMTTFWQGSGQRSLFGNGEAEYYVDKYYGGDGKFPKDQRINPFSFETPGVLTISATKVPEALWKNYWMGKERSIASGLLISDSHFTFEHGYMEGRFKLPNNKGAWPAFWLLQDSGGWGRSPEDAHPWPPEVDVFEFFGHRPTKHSAGVIGKRGEHLDWHFGYNEVGTDITQDFHTWAFEWDAKKMVWLFDGKIWATATTPESMNQPMYVLVNLAVGGTWYAQEQSQLTKTSVKPWEVDEASMPWKMLCDYVRVYQ